jgi:GNAT superfamily N-acetyltransferase
LLTSIKKILGSVLLTLQSISIWRKIGRKIFKEIVISTASENDLYYIHTRLNSGREYRPSNPNPRVTNLIASWHDHIIGSVQLVRHPPENYPYTGYWIFSLITLSPLYRGFGTGEKLCRTVIDLAISEKAEEIFLLVYQKNVPAVTLYQKLGFFSLIIPDLEERLIEEKKLTGKLRISMRKQL